MEINPEKSQQSIWKQKRSREKQWKIGETSNGTIKFTLNDIIQNKSNNSFFSTRFTTATVKYIAFLATEYRYVLHICCVCINDPCKLNQQQQIDHIFLNCIISILFHFMDTRRLKSLSLLMLGEQRRGGSAQERRRPIRIFLNMFDRNNASSP